VPGPPGLEFSRTETVPLILKQRVEVLLQYNVLLQLKDVTILSELVVVQINQEIVVPFLKFVQHALIQFVVAMEHNMEMTAKLTKMVFRLL